MSFNWIVSFSMPWGVIINWNMSSNWHTESKRANFIDFWLVTCNMLFRCSNLTPQSAETQYWVPVLSSQNCQTILDFLPSVLNHAILLIANGSESWESTGSTARSLAYSRIDYSKKFQKPQSMWRKSRDRGWLRRLFTKAHLFIHCAQKKTNSIVWSQECTELQHM